MPKEVAIVNEIIEKFSSDDLKDLFGPMLNLPANSTKAEIISSCLNNELAAYGFNSYPSPDRSIILVDNDTVSRILTFFKKETATPYITDKQVERVKALQQMAKNNNVAIVWPQLSWRKSYYYLKQYTFSGLNLYNVLKVNTANAALASTSLTGAAPLTMAGTIALSWSASLLLATVENYIPNDMRKFKAIVSTTKFVSAVPLRIVEWTANLIMTPGEKIAFGSDLPINMTSTHKFNLGPKLEDLAEMKRAVSNWTIQFFKSKINGKG